MLITIYLWFCVCVSELQDRNSEAMKQEVTRLQEMLNRLDFKRKVRICIILQRSGLWGPGLTKCLQKIKVQIQTHDVMWFTFHKPSPPPVRRSCLRWMLWSRRLMTWWPLSSTRSCRTGSAGSRWPPSGVPCSPAWTSCRVGNEHPWMNWSLNFHPHFFYCTEYKDIHCVLTSSQTKYNELNHWGVNMKNILDTCINYWPCTV